MNMFSYVNNHVKMYFQFSETFLSPLWELFQPQDFSSYYASKRKLAFARLHIGQIYSKGDPQIHREHLRFSLPVNINKSGQMTRRTLLLDLDSGLS